MNTKIFCNNIVRPLGLTLPAAPLWIFFINYVKAYDGTREGDCKGKNKGKISSKYIFKQPITKYTIGKKLVEDTLIQEQNCKVHDNAITSSYQVNTNFREAYMSTSKIPTSNMSIKLFPTHTKFFIFWFWKQSNFNNMYATISLKNYPYILALFATSYR